MAGYTDFKLPSGAIVRVQSSQPAVLREAGPGQASGVADKARETWNDGMELIRELAGGIVQNLREATARADEVAVEFGCSLSGKGGIILVEGSAAANLKVTIKWKGQG